MTGDRESGGRWVVTIVVTIALGLAGVAATLVAAGRLPCPVVCTPTPTPVASTIASPAGTPSIVDSGPKVALDRDSGPAGTAVQLTITGFGTGEGLEIRLEDVRIATGATDAHGTSHVPVVIPASYGTGDARQLTITVLGQTSQVVAFATFRVQPS